MQRYNIGRLNGRFVVTWSDAGKRRRYRLDALNAKDAEREARDLILKQTAPASGVTVAQVWGAYTAHVEGRRQADKMRQVGKNVLPDFGHLSPSQITADDCRAFIAKRMALGRKPGTIRTELNSLRIALSWGVKSKLIQTAPALELPSASPPRERYLTRPEAQALIGAAVDPHIRLAMLLMLTTAARIGALLELQWRQVDMEQRLIRLAAEDIGPRKGRATVPINDTLHAALTDAHAAAISPYVIEYAGRQVGSIKTGFNAAVTRAGIAHCTPHDLRRTAGRFMVEAGVPIEEVAQYLGHTNPAITRSTYARFSPSYLRKAASALEF